MTNNEFREKNNDYLANIQEQEDKYYKGINEIVEDAKLPALASAVSNKINGLFDLFENDGVSLDQHLTVILESQYLVLSQMNCARDIQAFFNGFVAAICDGEIEKAKSFLEHSGEKEQKWEEACSSIEKFDYMEGLEEVLNSGIPLPNGITKMQAYLICSGELKRVNYTPKPQDQFDK